MPAQPTILIKKKDGTSARMTMDEFKVYRDGTLAPKHSSTEAQKPVVKSVVKPVAKQWTKDDHKSPLEIGEVKEARKQEVVNTVLPEGRGDAFDAVIRNLKFPVADELRPRLKSLIVSRVKDIRTDEQVVEYATRAVVNGGLGLSDAQAGELVGAIGTSALQHRSTSAPKHFSTEAPNPVNRTLKADIRIPEKYPISNIQYPKEHRPIMHDVIAPSAPREEVKASVGPIEELQQLTLTDFRRLSSNPAQTGEILLGKFESLKKESYLLFIKAVQAWYNSPLYRQYQQTMADAINQSVKISGALGQLREEEYKAIVKLCNNL